MLLWVILIIFRVFSCALLLLLLDDFVLINDLYYYYKNMEFMEFIAYIWFMSTGLTPVIEKDVGSDCISS